MAGCPVTCLHRQHVENYRLQREAELAQLERDTLGYATETAERLAAQPVITFHDYLIATTGWNGDPDAA